MFTIADIRDIAVQIERNGEKAYRRAAEQAAEPEIAEMFTWMADQERQHARWFEQIASEKPLSEEQRELEKMGRELLRDMIADQTFSLEASRLQKIRNVPDMIGQSRAFERDTITFYEFLLNLIDDEPSRQQLEAIIAEERVHLEELGELQTSLGSAADRPV